MVVKKIGDKYIFPNFLLFFFLICLCPSIRKTKSKTKQKSKTKTQSVPLATNGMTAGHVFSTCFLFQWQVRSKRAEPCQIHHPWAPCPIYLLSEFSASWKCYSSFFLVPKKNWGIQSTVELSLLSYIGGSQTSQSQRII